MKVNQLRVEQATAHPVVLVCVSMHVRAIVGIVVRVAAAVVHITVMVVLEVVTVLVRALVTIHVQVTVRAHVTIRVLANVRAHVLANARMTVRVTAIQDALVVASAVARALAVHKLHTDTALVAHAPAHTLVVIVQATVTLVWVDVLVVQMQLRAVTSP